jgi:hypothetical protein
VQVDTVPPTTPGSLGASATSTSSVEITWTPSVDGGSGFAHYGIYRDGSLVATSTALIYTDSGLTPGASYEYTVTAFDVAGNESAHVAPVTASVPASVIWLTVMETHVDMGSVDPEQTVVLPSATGVIVGGVGAVSYRLSCVASDFFNTDVLSATPTMPIGVLEFITSGWVSAPQTPFGAASTPICSSIGSAYVWHHPYIFDFALCVPMDYEPGLYISQVTYTVLTD